MLVVLTIVVIALQLMEQLNVVLMAATDRVQSHVQQMDVVIVRQLMVQNLALL